MADTPGNKHQTRSAQTRERFIQSALRLFAQRSVDSVSLNEITVAAGQKNRNALQYHFGNRDGLLQAIIDKHADRVSELRQHYLQQASEAQWPPAAAAARVLVMPLADHIADNPEGIYYVQLVSQLAAINSDIINPGNNSRLNFHQDKAFSVLMVEALSQLSVTERQRRMFLIVSMTFHGIADICRASASSGGKQSVLSDREAMIEQLVCAIEALLASPPRER